MSRAIALSLSALLIGGAAFADSPPQSHQITITDLPTHIMVDNYSAPIPAINAAFGLFPEISVEAVQDGRAKAKPCFGTVDQDRRLLGTVVAQAVGAAGYSVVASSPLKIAFRIEALDCGTDTKTKRHASWRLSGSLSLGAKGEPLRSVTIDSGRTVESDFIAGTADNFRDIDTPQGVAAASLRDRLRDLLRSKQFQPE